MIISGKRKQKFCVIFDIEELVRKILEVFNSKNLKQTNYRAIARYKKRKENMISTSK